MKKYRLSKEAVAALAVSGLGAVAWAVIGYLTGPAFVYWFAALFAATFAFVAGAEWGCSMWQPLAEDAIDALHDVVGYLKYLKRKADQERK